MRTLTLRLVLLSIVTLSIAACGGGGGGGGNGGGGGGNSGSTLSVSVGSINIAANRGDALPSAQVFTVSWTGSRVAGFVIGVPPGETTPPWLNITTSGSTSPVTVTAGVATTDLDAGTYSVTLRIVTGDANANPIRTVDVPLTYTVTDDFRVSTNSLQANRVLGDTRQFARPQFTVSGANVDWSGTVDQPWVTLSPATGMAPQIVSVEIDSSGLPAGTNTATITIGNDDNPQQTIDVVLTVEVRPPEIILNRTSLDFNGVNGTNLVSQTIFANLENGQPVTWTASASDPWIVPERTSWTGQTQVPVLVDPSAATLASGTYAGEITISTTYGGFVLSKTLPVGLTLTPPTLSLTTTSLQFQGGPPTDFVAQDLEFFVNVGPDAYPWQVDFRYDSGNGWLGALETTGTISGVPASAAIVVQTAGLTEDRYTGSVDLTVTVNGDTLSDTVPVELLLEPHRLFVPDNGVALLDSPGPGKLSQTVTVSDNRKIPTPWTATSDQTWLSVTPSGTTDGDLVLTADPTGLAEETIHYAAVTIESTAASITNSGQETIRVGLYVTATAPADEVSAAVAAVGSSVTGMISDPIRPYVYVTHGLADIEVYNIYTGALVQTISNAGASLRAMTVSSDGSTLYVLDHTLNAIVTVDLDSNPLAANAAWTNPDWVCACGNANLEADINYTRINGRAVLIGGDKEIIDATSGVSLFRSDQLSFFFGNRAVTIPESGGVLFSVGTTSSSGSALRKVLKYSEIDDQFDIIEAGGRFTSGTNRGLSTDPDGDRVFRACWHPTGEIEIYSGADLSPISFVSSGTNGGALYGPDDLVYCARYYSELSAPGSGDVWAIDPDTRVISQEFTVPGEIQKRRYTISGDGLRLIMRSNSQTTLSFQAIQ